MSCWIRFAARKHPIRKFLVQLLRTSLSAQVLLGTPEIYSSKSLGMVIASQYVVFIKTIIIFVVDDDDDDDDDDAGVWALGGTKNWEEMATARLVKTGLQDSKATRISSRGTYINNSVKTTPLIYNISIDHISGQILRSYQTGEPKIKKSHNLASFPNVSNIMISLEVVGSRGTSRGKVPTVASNHPAIRKPNSCEIKWPKDIVEHMTKVGKHTWSILDLWPLMSNDRIYPNMTNHDQSTLSSEKTHRALRAPSLNSRVCYAATPTGIASPVCHFGSLSKWSRPCPR